MSGVKLCIEIKIRRIVLKIKHLTFSVKCQIENVFHNFILDRCFAYRKQILVEMNARREEVVGGIFFRKWSYQIFISYYEDTKEEKWNVLN